MFYFFFSSSLFLFHRFAISLPLRCLWFTCAVGTAATVATIQQSYDSPQPCTTAAVVVIIIIYIWFWHRVSWRQQQQQQQITKSHSARNAIGPVQTVHAFVFLHVWFSIWLKSVGGQFESLFFCSFVSPSLLFVCMYLHTFLAKSVANVNWTTCNRVHVTPDRLKRATIQMTWSRGARARHQRSFEEKKKYSLRCQLIMDHTCDMWCLVCMRIAEPKITAVGNRLVQIVQVSFTSSTHCCSTPIWKLGNEVEHVQK